MNSTHHITQLLHDWNNGDAEALNRLIPLADSQLKRIARKRLWKRPGTPFQPTDLVHEAWLKLFREKNEPVWTNRRQFYSLLARRMRQILWNYAKQHPDVKYTGLTGKVLAQRESPNTVILHEALEKFTKISPRAARVVELRYFGGYTIPAVAEIMKVGTKTIERDTEFARGWLWREINSKART
ncbi:MAG TPA: ECF-type sigma factor [Pyrinomonadaceae bacterium]|nr:ECF-type sigma factor [Pyrinomonadaceae bacterium]